MKWFVAIIVPILVYLGIGWIVKDIYFSIVADNGMTLKEVFNAEIYVYDIIAMLYCVIIAIFFDSDLSDYLWWIPLAMAFITVHILPISIGATILNSIVCIIVMICCTASTD